MRRWQLFVATAIVALAFLRPRWRFWYWLVIIVEAWNVTDLD